MLHLRANKSSDRYTNKPYRKYVAMRRQYVNDSADLDVQQRDTGLCQRFTVSNCNCGFISLCYVKTYIPLIIKRVILRLIVVYCH